MRWASSPTRMRQRSALTPSRMIVAAWAADEDLLGHGRLVHRFLVAQAAAGHLNDGLGDREPSGRAFVITLDHFLVRRGYLP